MKRHQYLWAVASVGILLLLSAIIFRATYTLNLAGARQAKHAQAKMTPTPAPGRVNASYRHGNDAISKPRILEAYGKLPMAFEANRDRAIAG